MGRTRTAIVLGLMMLMAATSCTSRGPTVTIVPEDLPSDDTTQFPAVDPPAVYVPAISVAPPDASPCVVAGGFCASGDISRCRIGPQDCGSSGAVCCDPVIPYDAGPFEVPTGIDAGADTGADGADGGPSDATDE